MKKSNRKFVIGAEYLCWIWNSNDVVNQHLVWRCREVKLVKWWTDFVFTFDINWDCWPSELFYRRSSWCNSTRVLTAKLI